MTLLHSPVYDEIRNAHMKPFRPGAVAQLEEFCREASVVTFSTSSCRGGNSTYSSTTAAR